MYQTQKNLFGMDLVAKMMEKGENISIEGDITPILKKYLDEGKAGYQDPIIDEETGEITFPGTYYTEKGNLIVLDGITIIEGIENIEEIPTPPGGTIQNGVPIPAGFYYVGGTKEEGVIISDNIADKDKGTEHSVAQTLIGNQFVWIPVDNPTDMYIPNGVSEGNHAGKLYIEMIGSLFVFNADLTGQTYTENSGVREPDVVREIEGTTYDGNVTNFINAGITGITTAEQFKTQLQNEFNNMIESLEEYKGFYIGRYETSLNGTKAESKQGKTVILGNWYSMYQKQKDMYISGSVRSGMIWGSQWSQAMIFVQKAGYDIIDSRGWGNYGNSTGNALAGAGSIQVTGYNEYWKACNIYDLAGNAWELTLGASCDQDSTDGRVTRGRKLFSRTETLAWLVTLSTVVQRFLALVWEAELCFIFRIKTDL